MMGDFIMHYLLIMVLLPIWACADEPKESIDMAYWASVGNENVLISAIKDGFEVDMKNAAGETALLVAVRTGNLRIVKLLINRGASLKQKTHGASLLEQARIAGHEEVLQYLLSQGAE